MLRIPSELVVISGVGLFPVDFSCCENVYSHFMTKSSPKRSPLALAILVLLHEVLMHTYRVQQLIKERGKEEVIRVQSWHPNRNR
jgi:hypothetical protein